MKDRNITGLSLFAGEIDYWDKELSFHGNYPDAIKNRSNPQLMYKEYPGLFEKYRAKLGKGLKVLDVGLGSSLYVSLWSRKETVYFTMCGSSRRCVQRSFEEV